MTAGTRALDRLTNELVDLPERVLSGRFVALEPTRRTLLAWHGDLVDAETRGGLAGTTVVQAGRTPSLATCLQVSADIEDWRREGANWVDVAEAVPPVVAAADVDKLLEVTALEHVARRVLAQLEDVCDRPSTELRFAEERVLVDRARRVSRRATQDLARNSDDWLRSTATGVVPRRVTSLVREELVDIYENRVTARLVDDVTTELRSRLRVLDQIAAALTHTLPGWWRKRERMASMWGAAYDGKGNAALARSSDLRTLVHRLDRLERSRLCQGVPRRARVSHPVRLTNLLRDDERYQAVGELYETWWKQVDAAVPPDEQRRQAIRQDRAFATVCFATLARAATSLAATPEAVDDSIEGLCVTTPWGEVSLTAGSGPDRSIVMDVTRVDGGTSRTRVVPLACELGSGEHADVEQLLELLDGGLERDADDSVVVLYPGTATDVLRAGTMASRLHRVPLETPRRPWVVGVSPLDLESQDRVDQVVRWYLSPMLALAYPPAVPAPPALEPLAPHRWLTSHPAERRVSVTARPDEHVLTQLRDRIAREARSEAQRLGGRGHETARRLEAFIVDLDHALAVVDAIATCPTCSSRARLVARGGDTFEATCSSCRTRYGVQTDARTSTRVPYLHVQQGAGAGDVSWQRFLGRDCWALPCESLSPDGRGEVINPTTGSCTARAAESSECERCLRASRQTPTPATS